MSNDAKAEDLVRIISLPDGHTTSSFLAQALPKIKTLAVICKNSKGNPPMNAEVQGYLTFLRTFLPWLETDATMTPSIRDSSHIDKALEVLYDPKYMCPEEIATQARRIYQRFQDEQWGEGNNPESDAEDSSPLASPAGPRTTTRTLPTNGMYMLARPPPPDHPIWGRHGIMHGFIFQLSRTGKPGHVFNPLYEAEKRPFKVFGHNGLEPGDWWPYQKVALFHGAHGHSMAGISGHAEHGAWSVVVSGSSKYEDLDHDLGDVLWYSSDHSHDNADPNRIVHRSNMTLSLHRSISNQKPVRVLRSKKGNDRFAPIEGIRYDGLYSVVRVVERRNSKGGLYELFELRRQADQRPLGDIRLSVPTRQQLADFERVNDGY